MVDIFLDALQVHVLDSQSRQEYAAFTSAEFADSFDHYDAIGASIYGFPIALLLVKRKRSDHEIDISWLFVAEKFRRQGVASALLLFLKNILPNKHSLVFHSYEKAALALGSLFEKMNYSPPEIYKVYFRLKFGKDIFSVFPYIRASYLSRDYQVLPWSAVPAEDYFEFKNILIAEGESPVNLNPTEGRGNMHEQVSSVCYYKGEIIAWLAVHQYKKDSFFCKSFFVRQNFRGTLISTALLCHLLHGQLAVCDEVPFIEGAYRYPGDPGSTFILNHCSEYLLETKKQCIVKLL